MRGKRRRQESQPSEVSPSIGGGVANRLESLEDSYVLASGSKEGVMQQHFSDIDACGTSLDSVCVLGGFLGELILTLSTLELLADEVEYANIFHQLLQWPRSKVGIRVHLSWLMLLSTRNS